MSSGIESKHHQAEPLTEEEEEQLWSTGKLGHHSPQVLVDTILFMCSTCCSTEWPRAQSTSLQAMPNRGSATIWCMNTSAPCPKTILIMERTGYHSIDGVQTHNCTSAEQHENLSDILALSKKSRCDTPQTPSSPTFASPDQPALLKLRTYVTKYTPATYVPSRQSTAHVYIQWLLSHQ